MLQFNLCDIAVRTFISLWNKIIYHHLMNRLRFFSNISSLCQLVFGRILFVFFFTYCFVHLILFRTLINNDNKIKRRKKKRKAFQIKFNLCVGCCASTYYLHVSLNVVSCVFTSSRHVIAFRTFISNKISITILKTWMQYIFKLLCLLFLYLFLFFFVALLFDVFSVYLQEMLKPDKLSGSLAIGFMRYDWKINLQKRKKKQHFNKNE